MYQKGSEAGEGMGPIVVSSTPPSTLSDRTLFLLKCSHASKLSSESMDRDVLYSECSKFPLRKCLWWVMK